MRRLRRKRRGEGFSLIELMIVIAVVAILAAVLVPNMTTGRAQAKLTACKENLRTLATGLENYAIEHGGQYPSNLIAITPDYVKVIPTCPEAGHSVVYKNGYAAYNKGEHLYTLVCLGDYHSHLGLPSNYPQYTSSRGLIEK